MEPKRRVRLVALAMAAVFFLVSIAGCAAWAQRLNSMVPVAATPTTRSDQLIAVKATAVPPALPDPLVAH